MTECTVSRFLLQIGERETYFMDCWNNCKNVVFGYLGVRKYIFNELVDLTKDLRQDVENANWLLLVANYKILKNMR